MRYWKNLLIESAKDTKLIDWGGLIAAALVFVVAYLITRKLRGKKDAWESVVQAVIAVSATATIFLVWLAMNFFALTPRRLSFEQDARLTSIAVENESLNRTNNLLRA